MECFRISSSDLKGILSPLFFISQPKNTKGFIELNKISEINPSRKINDLDLNDLVPYVGLPETNDLEIKEVLKRPYKEVKGRNIIKKDDILFARIEPSIFNKKYILAENLQGNDYAFTSTEFYIVKAKENVNYKFLFYMFFTNEVYAQILGRTTGSTGRRRLDRGVFENLLVPYPDKKTQNQIASLMDKAYFQKNQKEAEAQRLLDSINDYVLGELGIKLPELKDKMTYAVNSNEVQNNRADAYYYQPKFEEVEKAIKRGKFEVKKLKELVEFIPGYAFSSNDYVQPKGIKLLTIKNIKEHSIDLTEVTLLPEYFYNDYSKSQVKKDDIVIAMTGATIGKSFVFDMDDKVLLNQRVGIIRVSQELNNFFLLSFMKTSIFRQKIFRQSCGGAQPNISESEILSIEIPLPSLAVQNKIAEEVKSRMRKAEQLREEAKEDLEEAKREVEKIILG